MNTNQIQARMQQLRIARTNRIQNRRIQRRQRRQRSTLSLADFQTKFPILYSYVNDVMRRTTKKYKIVTAPVKSGKRLMVECYTLFDHNTISTNQNIVNFYITSLHRKADADQRKELEEYGLKVFSLQNRKIKTQCIKEIQKQLLLNKEVTVHLDELDYGCGDKQLLSQIYNKFDNCDKVKFIKYSATSESALPEWAQYPDNEEVEELPHYVPPDNFYYIRNYYDDDRVYNAQPFFEYDIGNDEVSLSEQGTEILDIINRKIFNGSPRTLAVIRIPGKFDNHRGKGTEQKFNIIKRLKNQIEDDYGIYLKFNGCEDHGVQWSKKRWWDNNIHIDKPTFLIISMVAGRSTAWRCHHRLAVYHTKRAKTTALSTYKQDQERPNYYIGEDNPEEHDILIYGNLLVAEYSAGYITLDQFMELDSRPISSRLKKGRETEILVVPVWGLSLQDLAESEGISEEDIKRRYILNKKEPESGDYPGYIQTNMRGSRDKFRNREKSTSVFFRKQIKRDKKEGLSENFTKRINVYYENEHSNPEDYKFVIRTYAGSRELSLSNSSMYCRNH